LGTAGAEGIGGTSGAGSAGGAGAAGTTGTGGTGGAAGTGVALGCDVTLGWGNAAGAAFSPTGDVVALYALGHAPELRHWPDDAQLPLAGVDGGASAVAFSPDGELFAASGPQGLKLWRISDGTLLQQISALAGARTISLSTAGDVIAVVSGTSEYPTYANGSTASVWRLADPGNILTLKGSRPQAQLTWIGVVSVAVSPDGARVAMTFNGLTGLRNVFGGISEWTTADGALAWSNGPPGTSEFLPSFRLLFSPDGKSLLATDPVAGTQLDFLDPGTGSLIRQLSAPANFIPSLFSSDGAMLAGFDGSTEPGSDGAAELVRVSDGTMLLSAPGAQSFLAAGVGPSTNPLLVVSQSGTAFRYLEFGANPDGTPVGSHQANSFGAAYVAISADDHFVASGQYTTEASPQSAPMLLWDSTALPTKSWPSGTDGRTAFSPDLSALFILDGTQLRAVPLVAEGVSYDVDTGGSLDAGNSDTIKVSHSGSLIGLPGPQHTAQLRRASDGKLLWTLWDLEGHTDDVHAVAFSPDEKQIATASADKRIRLWDTATGAGGPFLTGAVSGVERLVFTPAGSQIVSGDDNGDLRLWSLATGSTSTMTNVVGRVADLALSPDGSIAYVALGSTSTYVANGDVLRFHLPDWVPLTTVHAHVGAISDLALSADGTRLASSGDGVVRVQCVP
jgi:WD40 repeat protein